MSSLRRLQLTGTSCPVRSACTLTSVARARVLHSAAMSPLTHSGHARQGRQQLPPPPQAGSEGCRGLGGGVWEEGGQSSPGQKPPPPGWGCSGAVPAEVLAGAGEGRQTCTPARTAGAAACRPALRWGGSQAAVWVSQSMAVAQAWAGGLREQPPPGSPPGPHPSPSPWGGWRDLLRALQPQLNWGLRL